MQSPTLPADPDPNPRSVRGAQGRTRALVAGAALVVLTLAAHSPSLRNGFIWDDTEWVVNNVELRTLTGLTNIWLHPSTVQQYYPLVLTSFWVDYQLWGLTPLPYHLINLVAHAIGALLLWQCLSWLGLGGAWLAALVFAVHPIQVESVAWVTERKNVMCGAFVFAACLCMLRVLLPATQAQRPFDRRMYVAGVLLFILAMLSKTVACSLGAVLLLLVYWKRGTLHPRDLRLVSPLFLIGAALGLFTVWIEREQAGAKGAEWAFSFADRCIIAGRSLAFYVEGLIWPGERVFMPPRWQIDAADPGLRHARLKRQRQHVLEHLVAQEPIRRDADMFRHGVLVVAEPKPFGLTPAENQLSWKS